LINSLHHQGVKKVADGLVPVAWSSDGLVEAVERRDMWMVGLQWHPESLKQFPNQQKIFSEFILAANFRRGLNIGLAT